MKYFWFIISIFLMTTSSAFATDSTHVTVVKDSVKTVTLDTIQTVGSDSLSNGGSNHESKRFVDEDGDGLPDRGQKGLGKRNRDRFVDKDGDGICDHRSLTDKIRRKRHTSPGGGSPGHGGNH